jgi:hypothetical protein
VHKLQKAKVPDWSEEKESRQKRCCRKLTKISMKTSSSVKVVIDDESYFPFGHDEMPGNDRFYTKDKDQLPASIRRRSLRQNCLFGWPSVRRAIVTHSLWAT